MSSSYVKEDYIPSLITDFDNCGVPKKYQLAWYLLHMYRISSCDQFNLYSREIFHVTLENNRIQISLKNIVPFEAF